jgi:hypothetical protein
MDQTKVREMFVYEAEGLMRRIGGRVDYPGRRIGKDGRYLAWDYKGKTYYLHQLVWLYFNGYIPKIIDHINGDTKDNRIENLRECSCAQNQYNSPRKLNNKSGYKGVVEHKNCSVKKWQAKIVVNKKVVSLGYYASAEEAGEVYVKAAKAYAGNFAHPNPNQK